MGMILAGMASAEAGGAFDVGSRAQLFVDQVVVRSTENCAFTLHPAKKHMRSPLVVADTPCDGWRLEIYGSVLYDEDEKIFKMWYLGEGGGYVTHYAASKDGITWEKPLVGTLKSARFPQHNMVANGHLASVIKDRSDPDPARRYKMITWDYTTKPGAYRALVSPDGLNWTLVSEKPICRGGDVITGYYDEGRRLFVAFPKIGYTVRGHGRRVFWLITSKDFVNWTEPELVITPDLRDDAGSLARIEEVRPILDVPDDPKLMRTEFYGIGAYTAESCTLAFPWVFTINNNARYGNQEGPGELQLAVSRDLKNWERPFRVPCVPRGKIGEWDCGFFTTAAQAIRVGDEIWLYYGGSNYTHGTPCLYKAEGTGRLTKFTGSIGLAIWKLDRFVSVDGPAEGGTLTTVPIVFEGNRLEINAATKEDGSVVVDVLDAAGKSISTLGPSDKFEGDDLRHVVTWRGTKNIGDLAGKPVVLRFHLKNAELYSFAFRK